MQRRTDLGDADWDACVAAGGCRAADVPPSDNPLAVTVRPPGTGSQVPQAGDSNTTQPGWGLNPDPWGGINWWLVLLAVVAAVVVVREV